MRQGEPVILWAVSVKIPIPTRLARRAGTAALEKHMAKALVESFGKVPPDFIVKSAERVQQDARRAGLRLVGPDGKEIGSSEGGKTFLM